LGLARILEATERGDVASGMVNFRAADGRDISLKCPICSNSDFSSTAPDDIESRAGFQHVIIGVNQEKKQQMFLPVRFFHCTNCGYVTKFLIGEQDGEP
jgi:uncharacterized Zn finger protein